MSSSGRIRNKMAYERGNIREDTIVDKLDVDCFLGSVDGLNLSSLK